MAVMRCPWGGGFAEQSGGALNVASEPGQGSTVTFWLPVAVEAAANTMLPDKDAARQERGDGKVKAVKYPAGG